MKLSLRSEYALLSLIHLARHADVPCTSASLAGSLETPPGNLHEILIVLVNAKYVRLVRGFLHLAKPADKIPVLDIVRLFDGALAPLEPISENGYQPAPMDKDEKLAGLFGRLHDQIINTLAATTLADLT